MNTSDAHPNESGDERVIQPHNRPESRPATELLADLLPFENERDAMTIERLAEQEIIYQLELAGYDTASDQWKQLATALTAYGYSILTVWGVAGLLRPKAARHGKSGVHGLTKLPEDLRLTKDEAHEVIVELLLVALDAFRTKTLMNPDLDKRWDPRRGASIKSYFIGRCLMELPDVYVRWGRAEGRMLDEVVRFATLEEDTLYAIDPEHEALNSLELDEFFRNTGPQIEIMFRLHDEGYTISEIAELLSVGATEVTESMVRTRLHRARPHERSA